MTTLSTSQLQFPLAYLFDGTGVGVARTHDELTRVAPSVLRSGFTRGLRLVTVEGTGYNVTQADILEPRSAFGRWLAGVFELTLRMEFHVVATGPVELQDLRARVLRSLREEPEALEEHTDHPIEWWERYLDEAPTSGDLVSRLAATLVAG